MEDNRVKNIMNKQAALVRGRRLGLLDNRVKNIINDKQAAPVSGRRLGLLERRTKHKLGGRRLTLGQQKNYLFEVCSQATDAMFFCATHINSSAQLVAYALGVANSTGVGCVDDIQDVGKQIIWEGELLCIPSSVNCSVGRYRDVICRENDPSCVADAQTVLGFSLVPFLTVCAAAAPVGVGLGFAAKHVVGAIKKKFFYKKEHDDEDNKLRAAIGEEERPSNTDTGPPSKLDIQRPLVLRETRGRADAPPRYSSHDFELPDMNVKSEDDAKLNAKLVDEVVKLMTAKGMTVMVNNIDTMSPAGLGGLGIEPRDLPMVVGEGEGDGEKDMGKGKGSKKGSEKGEAVAVTTDCETKPLVVYDLGKH
eukprot:GHVQ01025421.1.p1 GENE.GHVQ01025421.1~~GHVQ01025421.1.p1  ORF type:complete len:365 (+),score=52.02 GHVQ01025421.1:46-1140(+)